MRGQRIYHQRMELGQREANIPTTAYPTGVYWLRIRAGERMMEKKLMIQN